VRQLCLAVDSSGKGLAVFEDAAVAQDLGHSVVREHRQLNLLFKLWHVSIGQSFLVVIVGADKVSHQDLRTLVEVDSALIICRVVSKAREIIDNSLDKQWAALVRSDEVLECHL